MEIVAILRGVTPDTVIEVAECLVQSGIKTIEVPLNSPNALESIRLLQQGFGDRAVIGAGTVLTVEQVEAVAQTGARLVLSPNMDVAVIERTRALGLTSIPGVATATEAFRALQAGANALKLFPADVLGVGTLKAWLSVDARRHAHLCGGRHRRQQHRRIWRGWRRGCGRGRLALQARHKHWADSRHSVGPGKSGRQRLGACAADGGATTALPLPTLPFSLPLLPPSI